MLSIFFLQLLVSFCPFLSWPVFLPNSGHSFTCARLCCLLHLFGNHLLRNSAMPSFPSPLPLCLSPFHPHLLLCCTFPPPFLCLAFSLMSITFLPGIIPHIPYHVVPLPPACSQVSAAVAAEVQDARRRPPAGLLLQALLPCGPLSPPWPSHRAMVPSLASQGPRNTHRYVVSWLLACLG